MSMTDWAENEIRIACERERRNAPEDEWEYGVACYESAYKAFKSLLEDGHSGMSIGITKNILNRLIDGKPLTPIEDDPDIWNHVNTTNEFESYQCKRMPSLFKHAYTDGTIKYSDIDNYICVDINNPNLTYSGGIARKVIEDMFPITLPYIPSSYPMKVYTEDFLTHPSNGDFDTVGVFYIIHPNGKRTEINRFFKNDGMKWEEINMIEYGKRKGLKL